MEDDTSDIEIRLDDGSVTLHIPTHSTAEQNPANRTVMLTLTDLSSGQINWFVFPSEMTLNIVGEDMYILNFSLPLLSPLSLFSLPCLSYLLILCLLFVSLCPLSLCLLCLPGLP